MRAELSTSTTRLSCARMLSAQAAGAAVAPFLDFPLELACQAAPSVVLLDQLQLLCCGETLEPLSNPARVASALIARLRTLGPGVIVLAAVAGELSQLPHCLRAHGGFEATFALPPPTASQRRALLREMLSSDAQILHPAVDAQILPPAVNAQMSHPAVDHTAGRGSEIATLDPESATSDPEMATSFQEIATADPEMVTADLEIAISDPEWKGASQHASASAVSLASLASKRTAGRHAFCPHSFQNAPRPFAHAPAPTPLRPRPCAHAPAPTPRPTRPAQLPSPPLYCRMHCRRLAASHPAGVGQSLFKPCATHSHVPPRLATSRPATPRHTASRPIRTPPMQVCGCMVLRSHSVR